MVFDRIHEQRENRRSGVAVALLLNIPLAYGLSIRDLRGRKWMTILVIIPYVFNVGLVPTYILVAKLKLINRLSSIYLPVAIGTQSAHHAFFLRRNTQ